MAKPPVDIVKLIGQALDAGGKIKTPIALLATVALVVTIVVAIILILIIFRVTSASETTLLVILAFIFAAAVIAGILFLVNKFIPIGKPVAPHAPGAIDLQTLATLTQRSSKLVDNFCFYSIKNLEAVKTACLDRRDLPTDAQTALSYIRSSTRFANMIVSVDFEIGSWSKILHKEDIDAAARKFEISPGMKDEVYPSTEVRFNAFHEIWSATLERLKTVGNSDAVSFVNPHSGILRTFVIWDERQFPWTRQFTWMDWAILKKLVEAERHYAERAARQIMVNKVVFESDLVKRQASWREKLREQQDIILFFEGNDKDLNLKELVLGALPDGLICSGVRETLHPKSEVMESFLLFQEEEFRHAYAYALGLWQIAKSINLEDLAKRVVNATP